MIETETQINDRWFVDHDETEIIDGNRDAAIARAHEIIDGQKGVRCQLYSYVETIEARTDGK